MQANLKGITHPCPYCEKDGRQPTPEQFALHQINHNPMSNSTQNDEIGKMEKAIDEGFAESERDLKDKKTPLDQPTQNDWEKRISDTYLLIRDAFWDEYLEHTTCDHDIGCVVTSDPIEKKVSLIMSTLLADARREVIEKVEKGFNRYRSDKYKTDSLALSYKRWVMLKNSIIKDDHI